MTPRKVPVNCDDLEMALTTNAGEWTCYLDTRNGEVQMAPAGHHGVDGDWLSEGETSSARRSERGYFGRSATGGGKVKTPPDVADYTVPSFRSKGTRA
jgi:hypothetical protein